MDAVIGPPGTAIDGTGRECLADADAATVYEAARWARRACLVTPSGRLVRIEDLGHRQAPRRPMLCLEPPCVVCGGVWPCPSRRLEQEAMQ